MKPDYGTLRAVQRTPDGTVVREHQQPVDSYVVAFVKLLSAVWGDQEVTGVTATDDATYSPDSGSTAAAVMDVSAASGQDSFGIVIGSGSTAETVTDNALETPLTTGIAHGAVTVSTGSVSGSTISITVTRTLTNNTGAGVTINEVGLVAAHDTGDGLFDPFLLLRDTGDPIDTVAAGNNTTMEFTLTFEV